MGTGLLDLGLLTLEDETDVEWEEIRDQEIGLLHDLGYQLETAIAEGDH